MTSAIVCNGNSVVQDGNCFHVNCKIRKTVKVNETSKFNPGIDNEFNYNHWIIATAVGVLIPRFGV